MTRAALVVALVCAPLAAGAAAPLSYLQGHGARAYPVIALTWGLLSISLLVIAAVALLVLFGTLRRRPRPADGAAPMPAAARPGQGLGWIYWGVGVSTLVLFGALVWTIKVLAAIAAPPRPAALTITVSGEQWWWRVAYDDSDPAKTFSTANEIHIPVGEPVRFRLLGADVIHSFWVPQLGGKTDLIPGQINTTWIEADAPGRYRGQCAEYCGAQHAHMAFELVAEDPQSFARWQDQQRRAAAPAAAEFAGGQQRFEFSCGACHTVRGTAAGGSTAPDLTHLMSRARIAAGTLPNEPGALVAWILDPAAVKPGTHMPKLDLAAEDVAAIRNYLATLQ